MRKSFGVKPLIYPQPVLIIGTYDKNGIANAMNAAWGGISEENEISIAGFHTEKSQFVNAPIICELPMAVECKLKSYDEDSCRLVGEIVNVCAEESILTNGKIDPDKLRPITYDGMNHVYYVLGERVGDAFSEGKKLK